MDINVLRAIVTVIGLTLFVALWVWAWSRRRKADFEEAAHLPFADSTPATAAFTADFTVTKAAPSAQPGARS